VTYDDGGTQKQVTRSTIYDGWGQAIQEFNEHGGQVNTTYDAMGRVMSRTNPFTAGGTPGPATSYQYDALGRAKQVTLPDSNTIQTTYSGTTETVTDQVNRKIQRIADGLGRLVTVNEQDASGSLTQATSYTYNYLDKLTLVN
jgi:YD repeat-containing protein